MKNYKELDVWKKAVDFAVETYELTRTFPNEERYGLASQIRRSSTSISANIAEGWGRGTTKEYIQFLLIARGSLMELESHLIISQRLGYVRQQHLRLLQEGIEELGRMLNGLIRSLRAPDATARANP